MSATMKGIRRTPQQKEHDDCTCTVAVVTDIVVDVRLIPTSMDAVVVAACVVVVDAR
jgi:hypothetical protein